ncbi:MAG: hypothetical protein WAO06_09205, partial [Tenuifilaceae bacterium]
RNTVPIRSDDPSPISCGPNILDIQETAKYTPRHKKEVLINSTVLSVLALMRDEFNKSPDHRNTTELRKEAVQVFAEKELRSKRFKNKTSAINTIHDACSRRLKPDVDNITDFDNLVDQWLRKNSKILKDILLGHAESNSHRALVKIFFEN